MKRYVLFCSAFLVLLLLISGCSNSNQSDVPEAIEVAVETEPEQLNPNEELTIKAIVTQGEEKVDDANEVAFEIWKNGEEKHKLVTAEGKGDGVYSAKHIFPENGAYSITAHVTARDMHTMPTIEVQVGAQ